MKTYRVTFDRLGIRIDEILVKAQNMVDARALASRYKRLDLGVYKNAVTFEIRPA